MIGYSCMLLSDWFDLLVNCINNVGPQQHLANVAHKGRSKC
jgi:hypothetical protein